MKNTTMRHAVSAVLLILSLALPLMVPSSGHAATGASKFISEEVATINGDVLTENELFFRLMLSAASDTVMDLVEDYVIIDQADTLGVTLQPNAVVEYLASAYPPEKLIALMDGFGEDTLEETVGTQLLALKIITTKVNLIVEEHDITITDQEVNDFFIRNKPTWTTPESVRFSLIEVDTRASADAARQRIVNGESFEDVCRAVSTHPVTRDFGGDIGGFVPKGYATGERQLLEDTAFALAIGELSQPLQVQDKWYLVKTTDKLAFTRSSRIRRSSPIWNSG